MILIIKIMLCLNHPVGIIRILVRSVIITSKVNLITIITVKANKEKEYSTSHIIRQRSDVGSARERAGQKEITNDEKEEIVLKIIYSKIH
jgi:hypothetical protein